MVFMVFIYAFLTNEASMVYAVPLCWNIWMILTTYLGRITILSYEVLDRFIDDEHKLFMRVIIAIVLLVASSALEISLFCDVSLSILWWLNHFFFNTMSAGGLTTAHHNYGLAGSIVESFCALETV
jgi:hypothetical protein